MSPPAVADCCKNSPVLQKQPERRKSAQTNGPPKSVNRVFAQFAFSSKEPCAERKCHRLSSRYSPYHTSSNRVFATAECLYGTESKKIYGTLSGGDERETFGRFSARPLVPVEAVYQVSGDVMFLQHHGD